MSLIQVVRTDFRDNDFRKLVDLLDRYLAEVDGDDHAFYDQFNSIEALDHVVVAKVDQVSAGCGAFKPHDSGTVEIKRMFVQPESRRMGVAAAILSELEKWASELSFKKSVLETGEKQTDAIKLYLQNGYMQIPNYGQYAEMENSKCFEKRLKF